LSITTLDQHWTIACRTNLKKFTILYQGPKIWNSLPTNIKDSLSLYSFKKTVMKFLLNYSFCRTNAQNSCKLNIYYFLYFYIFYLSIIILISLGDLKISLMVSRGLLATLFIFSYVIFNMCVANKSSVPFHSIPRSKILFYACIDKGCSASLTIAREKQTWNIFHLRWS
jgi:hypothetical protein